MPGDTATATTLLPLILVATRKGAWLVHGDAGRSRWRLDGPHFLGHIVRTGSHKFLLGHRPVAIRIHLIIHFRCRQHRCLAGIGQLECIPVDVARNDSRQCIRVSLR